MRARQSGINNLPTPPPFLYLPGPASHLICHHQVCVGFITAMYLKQNVRHGERDTRRRYMKLRKCVLSQERSRFASDHGLGSGFIISPDAPILANICICDGSGCLGHFGRDDRAAYSPRDTFADRVQVE